MSIPKRTIYAIPAAGGTPVPIPVTVNGVHYVEIEEVPPDGSNSYNGTNFAPQGLNYTLPDDSFVLTHGLVPGDVLEFGNKDSMARQWGGRGLGFASRVDNSNPGGPNIPATVLCKLISATSTATIIQTSEWL